MKKKLSIFLVFLMGAGAAYLMLETPLLDELRLRYAQASGALYPDRDWNRGTPSRLNISVFTFSDRNRNGIYDLEDKPLANIAVRMTRPDGSSRITRSNINGYTNFEMQLGGSDADITVVDENYRFETLPPLGWEITTGNKRQETRFRQVSGSIAGMGAETPPKVVGLTPALTVSGVVPGSGAGTALAQKKDGESVSSRIKDTGDFSLTLAPGDWELSLKSSPTDKPVVRPVQLSWTPVVVGFSQPSPSSWSACGKSQ